MTDLYSNYLERTPSPLGERLVIKWHERMANHACLLLDFDWRRIRLVEVGPGHGYFADLVTSRGCEYRFIDNSSPVINLMISKGHKAAEDEPKSFDVVWLSHVLEHSTDWMAARNLLSQSAELARSGGTVVVIGPDYLSWGARFFDTDATHGFPTTLRTVAQLMRDVGLDVTHATYHRGGHLKFYYRMVYACLARIPLAVGKLVFARGKLKSDDHPVFSFKAVLGWRQIFVVGSVRGKQ